MIQLFSQKTYDREAIKSILLPVLSDQPSLLAAVRTQPSHRPRVLLKPNFVMAAPRQDASTTHPEFYMAVAEALLELGFEVGIGESPGFGSCKGALKAHDVLDECQDKDIKVVEFRTSEKYAGVADERSYQALTIASELNDWDFVINLPKLKTHQQFTFTGASKNLYGCVAGKRKFVRHNLCKNDPVRFARMIVANAEKAGCILHIGDGIDALHVKGPRGGETYPLGKIIISEDYLAHDWLFCRLINLAPEDTPLFKAVTARQRRELDNACKEVMGCEDFEIVHDFIHAPLIDIGFQPWHIARSGWRTLRYRISSVGA